MKFFYSFEQADKMDFARSLSNMFEFSSGQPIILYKPVIERDFGQERFLTQHPSCGIRQGKFQRVNILTGLTQYEFLNPAVCEFENRRRKNIDSMKKNKMQILSSNY